MSKVLIDRELAELAEAHAVHERAVRQLEELEELEESHPEQSEGFNPFLRNPAAPVVSAEQKVDIDLPGMWSGSDLSGGAAECDQCALEIERYTPISQGEYIPHMNRCTDGKWMTVKQHLNILAATADLLSAAPAPSTTEGRGDE